MTDLRDFITFAEQLAEAGRATVLRFSASALSAENKATDGRFDPVTEADRETERTIRALIEARFPAHGIEGEEFGRKPAEGRYSWSLDPIDGTRAFICGLPSWTILIALLDEGRPIVGVIDVPRLDERYSGCGQRAELVTASGRTPLRTSACRALAEARFSTTDSYLFSGDERDGFERVRGEARVTRYGLDAYGYARVAAGTLDLVIESGLAPHDLNALVPVVTAAGGVVTDWQGGDDLSQGRLVAAATVELAQEAVARLAI